MINTIQIKKQQILNGYFKTGTGSRRILIVGSCRAVHLLNYLDIINESNEFEICFIDPFNWNWDINENRVDYEAVINSLENDPRILNLLSETEIYIHEYYSQFGMFNSSCNNVKNIYQFGLNPRFEYCMPNFNDVFILYNDFITFDAEIRDMVKEDAQKFGRTSFQTLALIKNKAQDNIDKFISICMLSDCPEMAEYFKDNFSEKPLFYTYNHTSKWFTLFIFDDIRNRLGLNVTHQQDVKINEVDMFCSPRTAVTDYDLEMYNLKWK